MTNATRLKMLPADYVVDGDGFRRFLAGIGVVEVFPCKDGKGWLVMNEASDGGPRWGNWYPTFKQAAKAVQDEEMRID